MRRGSPRASGSRLGALAALTDRAWWGSTRWSPRALIEPYVRGIYGMVTTISQGNIVIMSIMLGMVALFPATFFVYGRRVRVVDAYLGGGNVDSSVLFQGAGGRGEEHGDEELLPRAACSGRSGCSWPGASPARR